MVERLILIISRNRRENEKNERTILIRLSIVQNLIGLAIKIVSANRKKWGYTYCGLWRSEVDNERKKRLEKRNAFIAKSKILQKIISLFFLIFSIYGTLIIETNARCSHNLQIIIAFTITYIGRPVLD